MAMDEDDEEKPAQAAAVETEPLSSKTQLASEEPYTIFSKRQKVVIVAIISTAATFSGFATNIYFPALPTIAEDLGVSIELVNLTVTSYLIFQGLAPSLWGPVADVRGRRLAYVSTFIVFLGACSGLAETKKYVTLLVLRCLQSTGSASTLAIGSGVISDITTRANRGSYMGFFQAGLLIPVAVGPVIGGALAEKLGWRAIFWFLSIYCAAFLLILILLLPETLRSMVGNGGRTPQSFIARYPLLIYQRTTTTEWRTNADQGSLPPKKRIDVTAPFRVLFSKFAVPIIFFLAIYYAVWQMSITAMATLFKTHYGLTETDVGLTYIANGIGSVIGTLVTGKMLDSGYKRAKARYDSRHVDTDKTNTDLKDENTNVESQFPLEKARLRLVPILSTAQCLAILLFGWTIHYPNKVHIAVPIISTFVTGFTTVSTGTIVMTYLVDIFSDQASAASASLNLARCLLGAGGTSFVMPMIHGIGVGWAFTVCTFAQSVAVLGLVVQWKYAGRWRWEVEERKKGAAHNTEEDR